MMSWICIFKKKLPTILCVTLPVLALPVGFPRRRSADCVIYLLRIARGRFHHPLLIQSGFASWWNNRLTVNVNIPQTTTTATTDMRTRSGRFLVLLFLFQSCEFLFFSSLGFLGYLRSDLFGRFGPVGVLDRLVHPIVAWTVTVNEDDNSTSLHSYRIPQLGIAQGFAFGSLVLYLIYSRNTQIKLVT